MQRIFINIASLLDSELIPTIKSALRQAASPDKLHFSVVVQDIADNFEEINSVIKEYNAGLSYKFIKLEDVRGVGYARSVANEFLSSEFEYYLQIDSHTRFAKEWDIELIAIYNQEGWDNECRFIYSTYPQFYGYVNDLGPDADINSLATDENNAIYLASPLTMKPICTNKIIKEPDSEYPKPHPFAYDDDFNTRITQYMCAGFAFGRAEYFMDVPIDPSYAYTGEEISISMRFFNKDIKVVCPTIIPLWHDYDGGKHKRRANFYVDQEDYMRHAKMRINWIKLEKDSKQYLNKFLNGEIEGAFGMSKEKIDLFNQTYILEKPSIDVIPRSDGIRRMSPLGQART